MIISVRTASSIMVSRDERIEDRLSRLLRHPQQLLNRSLAFDYLAQPVFLKEFQAVLDSLLANGVEVRVISDHIANSVVDYQQFKNAGSAVVSGSAAL